MPGGAGKAKRSCPMCKPYKFAGNGKDRRKHSELALAEGHRQQIREVVEGPSAR